MGRKMGRIDRGQVETCLLYTSIKRKQEFRAQIRPKSRTRHVCAVCGRTDEDSPGMEFRYCSKCEGSYEYCMDHLYTHKHIKKSDQEQQ